MVTLPLVEIICSGEIVALLDYILVRERTSVRTLDLFCRIWQLAVSLFYIIANLE